MPSEDYISVADLFPPGDVQAEWVYSLTLLADDLVVIANQLKPALEHQHLRETLFFSRQMFTRIYEAKRLIAAMDTHPDIETFAFGPERNNPWTKLLADAYRTKSDQSQSLVERTYGPFRHRTVHISWPGSEELANALRAAGPLPARIHVSPDGPINQWVHAVSGMQLFGDLERPNWMQQYREMNDLAGQIAGAWIMLSDVILVAYAHERAIDLKRLHVTEE